MRSCSAHEDVRFCFERDVFGGHLHSDGVEGPFGRFFEGEAEVVTNFFRWVNGEGGWVWGGICDVGSGGDLFSGLQVDGGGDSEIGFKVEADGFFPLVEDVGGEVHAGGFACFNGLGDSGEDDREGFFFCAFEWDERGEQFLGEADDGGDGGGRDLGERASFGFGACGGGGGSRDWGVLGFLLYGLFLLCGLHVMREGWSDDESEREGE